MQRYVELPIHALIKITKKKRGTTFVSSLTGVSLLGLAATLALTDISSFRKPAEPVAVETATADVAKLEKEAATLVLPASLSLRMGKGDTLVDKLTETGVTTEEAHEAVAALKKFYDPRKLGAGSSIALDLEQNNKNPEAPSISELSMPISKLTTIKLLKQENGQFKVRKVDEEVFRKVVGKKASISGSLYETGRKMGISPSALAEIIKALSYDVDFQRDIKHGQKLEVAFERMQTAKGDVVGSGGVHYVNLDLGKRQVEIFRYTDKNGNSDYYNAKGESLRKALLKTPINGARITSGFGMRVHPLLGYSKMHRGVDFGAATGTPIYAAGDGVVEKAGWANGFGNYVKIKHNDKYATGYGHASRIASGITPGAKVKQGQVIAYVGSTGASTGPHLHYEVYFGGDQVNPSGIKFRTGTALAGNDLKQFNANLGQVYSSLGKPIPAFAKAEPAAKKSKKVASKTKKSSGKQAQAEPKKTARAKARG